MPLSLTGVCALGAELALVMPFLGLAASRRTPRPLTTAGVTHEGVARLRSLEPQTERLAIHQPHRVAVVFRKHHRESFECRRVLEGFDLAQPTEATSSKLAEVAGGQVLGVEQRAAFLLPAAAVAPRRA